MKKSKVSLFFILVFLLTGCFIGAGTYGAIKGYHYKTKKENLEKAVMYVIKYSPNIYRDTSLDYLGSSPLLDHEDTDSIYSAGDNYYNDIKHYVTITIASGKDTNQYTFRYYGYDEDWKTSNTSEIFICYAHDKNGFGGSEGDGKITRVTAKALTDVFEREFITKIDKKLNLVHIDDN